MSLLSQPGHPGLVTLVQVKDGMLRGHGVARVQVNIALAVHVQVDAAAHLVLRQTAEEEDVQPADWGGEDSGGRVVGRP